ncbi:MAG: hypothetical protein Kow00121_49340 [Elainellaceae cyanobacterium]
MKFCKVADIADWNDPEFQAIAQLLGLEGFQNRKVWEHLQVYRGLQHLGLLTADSKALGLGVGRERIIYALANVCGSVVATDLYNSPNWQTAALSPSEVYEQNPFPYARNRLVVQHMDMTQIAFPDDSFDFVWSCCAIEHVNNFQELHQVYREIHRVLKPGGIAALTTEYNATDRHSYEPNMLFTDRHWIEHWLTRKNPLVQGFELLDTPDLTLTPDPGNEPQPRRTQLKTAIPIFSRDIVLNSVSFFLRKSGVFARDYEESWLDPAVRLYLSTCDRQRLQDHEGAIQGFQKLVQDSSLDSRLRVAAAHHLLVLLRSSAPQAAIACARAVFADCCQDENSDHLLPIAHQFKKLGLWDEAKRLYERIEHLAGARDVQVVRSLLGQAECFAQQGEWQRALELAERAYQSLPVYRVTEEGTTVNYHRGVYYEKLGRWHEAITAYQQAIAAAAPASKLQEKCKLRLAHCQEALSQGVLNQNSKRQLVPQRLKTWFNQFQQSIASEKH